MLQRWLCFIVLLVCNRSDLIAQSKTSGAIPKPGNFADAWTPVTYFDWSQSPSGYHPGFLKSFSLESFGYSSKATDPGYEFSTAYTSSLYNVQRLECPGCLLGPVRRTRFALPPFGAKAVYRMAHNRIELFSSFTGIQAWKPDGSLDPLTGRGTSVERDSWLAQAEVGARVVVDPKRRVSVGGSLRQLRNLGPGKQQWTTFSGVAAFTFGR